MSEPAELKRIDQEFIRSITKIQDSKLEGLFKFQNIVRSRIYKYLNMFLPKYMSLNVIDHRRLIVHMSNLKKQYAKRNQVEDIQSNLFKLGVLFGLVYIAVPQESASLWLDGVQRSFKLLKRFVSNSINSISNIDPKAFFKNFVDLGFELLKVFFHNTAKESNTINLVITSLLYMITMLFLVELGVLVNILILDRLEVI